MSEDTWAEYYKDVAGREPRRLLLESLEYVKQGDDSVSIEALDVGAGDLIDSRYLLEKGFNVTAFDSSPASLEISKTIHSPNFRFVSSSFENFDFPTLRYDLISAQLALPFNPPDTFPSVFVSVVSALKKGGIFAGHFFGVNDAWNTLSSNMTFLDRSALEKLLGELQIISFEEEESDMPTASGKSKHWHVFSVIAKRI